MCSRQPLGRPREPSREPAGVMAKRKSRESATAKVAIRGDFFTPTGMAKVNRELALRLQAAGCRVAIIPFDDPPAGLGNDPRYGSLAGLIDRGLDSADILVCHHWPDNLKRPPDTKVVLMQAWEYGWLPRGWPELIDAQVDEVWCYSEYVRSVYARSGVPEEKLALVPLGVDAAQFAPQGPRLKIPGKESFKFLWMGLASPRKGVDALLEAYTREFGAFENVLLVVKDLVLDPSYSAGFRERLKLQSESGMLAPMLHLTEAFPDSQLPTLYRACDAFVLPFRSEGFCLTIPEAMACGLPVVCTGYGPPIDYCDDSNSYLVACEEVEIGSEWYIGVETINPPFWAEPDVGELRRAMRRVFENRDEARAKGRTARRTVAECLSWDRTLEAALERIEALAGRSSQLSVVSLQTPDLRPQT
jgi:glycosyltransferase involved in cell wall biosynthesis